MKKTYMIPTTDVVEVELQQIMEGSVLENGFSKSETVTLDGETINGNMSRGAFWDDEE